MPGQKNRLPVFTGFGHRMVADGSDAESDDGTIAYAINTASAFIEMPPIPPSPEEELMFPISIANSILSTSAAPAATPTLLPLIQPSPEAELMFHVPMPLAAPRLPSAASSAAPSPLPTAAATSLPPLVFPQIAHSSLMTTDIGNVPQIPPPPPPPPIVIAPAEIHPTMLDTVPRLQHITNHMHSYVTPNVGRPGVFTVEVFVEHHFYVEHVGMVSLASRASRVIRAYSSSGIPRMQ